MEKLLNPKTVAVIGVSREPGKIGNIIFDNIKDAPGKVIYGVNPNADMILGEKMYPTVLDIMSAVDLAIICVPDKLVAQVLESCGKKRIPFAIIITSGFSEAGISGKERELEIATIAKKHKIRILGPNCLGVIDNFNNFNASFATATLPEKYRVGIFSQSGAMGAAILDYANGNDFGFSYFVSLGNKMDISEIDLIDSWYDDENVSLAIGYLEDIKNGPLFMEKARKFTEKKPLIILKGGMSKAGNKAANLHTAALAQDEKVFEAAMKEAGVIMAKNLSDLFELAVSFSQNPRPKGKNLVVISNAGGPSVLAADACSDEKVDVTKLGAFTMHELLKKTQSASVENPIDLRGDAKSADFALAVSLCGKDKNVEGILVVITPQAMTEVEDIAWKLVEAKKSLKKPLYVNFIGGELVSKARTICTQNGVACFSYPERAVRAFAFQASYEPGRKKSGNQEVHPKSHVAKSILHFSQSEVSPVRISSFLRVYGIEMTPTYIAKNPAEAISAVSKINGPAVMKIYSPDILHKTDVGGVILGVSGEAEAEKSFDKIISNVKKQAPKARINGVTVMETAKEGLELFVGAKKDPVFGPVVVFGFGGIYVELISDIAISVGPFYKEKLKKMIEETAVYRIIKGYRKDTNYNEKKLVETLYGISQVITEHPEINSIEINPLILTDDGKGAVGLDAKIEIVKPRSE